MTIPSPNPGRLTDGLKQRGHRVHVIHTGEVAKRVGDIHYLNSGDWVESLTATIEHNDGRMELVQYEKFLNSLRGFACDTGRV